MSTERACRERNLNFISLLEDGHTKKASSAVDSFTRTTMREEGFYRKIMPMVQITNDELTRRVDSEIPWIVIDKEPNQPPALSVPFSNLTSNFFMQAPRYAVQFDRVMTNKFIKDVDLLRTYQMDVRQVFSDNAIKDMLAEEDGKFLTGVNAMLGTVNTNQVLAGTPLNVTQAGSMGRTDMVEALKTLLRTPYHLTPHTCLTNHVSWMNFMKWGRDEMGGDKSEEVIVNGMHMQRWLDKNWVVTIKRNLVADNAFYMFADPKFLGKSFVLEDTTMYMKKEAFMIEYMFYESIGGAIAGAAAALVTFI